MISNDLSWSDPVSRREFIRRAGSAAVAARVSASGNASPAARQLPNIVMIYADDLGYGDVGVFGGSEFDTPNLDRMAADGVRFTDFYVAQPVCSASRAALLTGCYSNRIGILGALGPKSQIGISDSEVTIAQLVKQKNYATAVFGKWHLGCQPQFLPTRHGFDEYLGLPYSNDMWPFHPETPKDYPDLPLIDGEKIVAYNPPMDSLTTRYTERAVAFIEKNRERPFFLYLAHNMPHVPLGVSPRFRGKSRHGLYGDVIMEIDWSAGEVLQTLRRLGLDEDTLVIFASDNGPWLSYGEHSGHSGLLREGKGTTWEGGVRVPCIMRWPAQVPRGLVCREPAMTIDILPTVAQLVGAHLPRHKIDGLDIRPLMAGKQGARSPHDALYFYWNEALEAVRSGRWKMHFPHSYRTLEGKEGGKSGQPVKYGEATTGLALFDLVKDPGETQDVSAEHADVVARLKETARRFDEDLKHRSREPGRLPAPAKR
jgi:arylsulfatase A